MKDKTATICVLGLGRVGLPLASVFASKGLNVIGVDINEERVLSIKNGKCPKSISGKGNRKDMNCKSCSVFLRFWGKVFKNSAAFGGQKVYKNTKIMNKLRTKYKKHKKSSKS